MLAAIFDLLIKIRNQLTNFINQTGSGTLRAVEFTSTPPGSIWTVPNDVKYVDLLLVAGGGNGGAGGASGSYGATGGGGGGAGGIFQGRVPVTAGSNVTVLIGGAVGNSTFGSITVAAGQTGIAGRGASTNATCAGANGGVGSTYGQSSASAGGTSSSAVFLYSDGGCGASNSVTGKLGGAGGLARTNNTGFAGGNAAPNSGAGGGGGGSSNSTAGAGGAGGSGYARITYTSAL